MDTRVLRFCFIHVGYEAIGNYVIGLPARRRL